MPIYSMRFSYLFSISLRDFFNVLCNIAILCHFMDVIETCDFKIQTIVPLASLVFLSSKWPHCICILGIINKGDIGELFPPSNNKWKNADSSLFLKHAITMLKKEKGRINNIDTVIICEKPKILDYSKEIRKNIAKILEIDPKNISIKGLTFFDNFESDQLQNNYLLSASYDLSLQ